MNIENYNSLKLLSLPNGWHEVDLGEIFPPRQNRAFSPADAPEVKIEIFSSGIQADEKTSSLFRQLLLTAPKILFEQKENEKPTSTQIKLFNDLQDILGNASNNQIINSEEDFRGPSFILEKAETLNWNRKNLLAVRGWFRDTDEDTCVNNFCGFFLDMTPGKPECQVEEIFLEAKDEKEFLRYLPIFQESLKSIQWK